MNKIINIKKNCLGTLDIEAKFNKMRKPQAFTVYPLHEGNETNKIKIQSDTRIGYIYMNTGVVSLCQPHSNGAYNVHLMFVRPIDKLSIEDLAGLKFRLMQTADKMAGNNALHVFTDNSGAEKVTIF